LKKRKSNIDSIQKAAKAVIERSEEDTSLVQSQLIDLTTKWDKVSSLSTNKRQRLNDAYTEVWLASYLQSVMTVHYYCCCCCYYYYC